MSTSDVFKNWQDSLNAPNPYIEDIKKTNQQGKQLALAQMNQNLGTGLRNATAVAGASGLTGGGGRTQRMLGQVTQNVANQSGQIANQYDQNLSNALFQDAQQKNAAMQNFYGAQAQNEQNKENQPTWQDYLMQGLGIAGNVVSKFIKPV